MIKCIIDKDAEAHGSPEVSGGQPRIVFESSAFDACRRNEAIELSVVVPVYNVAPYVEDCLNSLTMRPPNRAEIIVVNDGSSDNSLAVVIDWARQFPDLPILVLDQQNQGLSCARNAGLEYARGQYVAFLDSDDFFAPGVYDTMLSLAREQRCEIVYCRSVTFDSVLGSISPFYDAWLWEQIVQTSPFRITTARAEPRLFALEPNACTRIAGRAFLLANQIRFPPGLYFEDVPVQLRMLLKAKRIGVLNSTGYHYRINRPGKITDEKSLRRFDCLVGVEDAISGALSAGLTNFQGAYISYALKRIVFWCGESILRSHRERYFREACRIFQRLPKAWIEHFSYIFRANPNDVLPAVALYAGDLRLLLRLCSRRRLDVWSVVRLALGPIATTRLMGAKVWRSN